MEPYFEPGRPGPVAALLEVGQCVLLVSGGCWSTAKT